MWIRIFLGIFAVNAKNVSRICVRGVSGIGHSLSLDWLAFADFFC
jgi:hypothetical protein